MVETIVTVSRLRRLPVAGFAEDAGCRGSGCSLLQSIAVPGQVSPAVSPRATQPTKKSGKGRRSDCPRSLFTWHTLMSSVGTLDSRRANAQESGCQFGSPNVTSTIVSAHSPPREIGRVSAQAVSGHWKWVLRALRTIQRLCARSVKLSNHAEREFGVSLTSDGRRKSSKNCLLAPSCAHGRRAAVEIGDLAYAHGHEHDGLRPESRNAERTARQPTRRITFRDPSRAI